VRHSEFNASKADVTHFYQIWIMPNADGAPPRYDQKRFDDAARTNKLRLIASGDGADGSIAVRQDVKVYASILEPGGSLSLTLPAGRHLWVQALRGSFDVNGKTLSAGDGLAASGETEFRFSGDGQRSELLAFDLD
jgi:hypothetical protein